MRIRLPLVAAFALAFSLTGCISGLTGGPVDYYTHDNVAKQVVKGQTTKEQVRSIYGEPQTIKPQRGGEEMWTYRAEVNHEANEAARNDKDVAHSGVDTGSQLAGSAVGVKHGYAAGKATEVGTGAAGSAAVEAAGPEIRTVPRRLQIIFDKNGVVKSYRLTDVKGVR